MAGLISDGGVHSQQDHLYALIKVAKELEIPHVYIHFFGDGLDTDPKSGLGYMQSFLDKIKDIAGGKDSRVQDGDQVFFFNYRSDCVREITHLLGDVDR